LRVICGTRAEFRGLENIPKGALLVAPKHQSFWETFALAGFFDDFSYVLKRELTYIPFFGWYLIRAEQIAIDRASAQKALRQLTAKAKALFAEGRQLFLFPEGTRRTKGLVKRFEARPRSGAARIALEAGVPLVPVAVKGTDKLTRLGRLSVAYGAPVEIDDLRRGDVAESAHAATERLMEQILELEASL